MFKQIIALILISLVIVFFMPYVQTGIQGLMDAHNWISNMLRSVFSGGEAGNMARGFIALLCIPVLAGAIPAVIYWIIKRRWLPYFMQIIWVVWLIEVGALVSIT